MTQRRRYPPHTRSLREYDRALARKAVGELIRGKNLVGPGIEKALLMEAEGKSQREIAQAIGVTQGAISRALAKFRDTRKLARFRLHASADSMASHAITAAAVAAAKGDGTVALELLDRLDVAVAKRREGGTAPHVMVVVGRADPAALPDFSTVVAQIAPPSAQVAPETT